jgi:proteasome lid subunit RPN8/RPN11|tara:strand:+ start:859 stop:1266 length:408 start_codon:yes stop_codon:yes gene_type:complete
LQKSIIIKNSDKEKLIQHAKCEEPYESCAILIGEEIEHGWKVTEVFLTENIEKSKINFTINPQEEFKIDEIARQKNLEIVSIFHSHPTSEPIPSDTDKKFMQVNPYPWIIYSGVTNTLKAYSLNLESNDISIDVV